MVAARSIASIRQWLPPDMARYLINGLESPHYLRMLLARRDESKRRYEKDYGALCLMAEADFDVQGAVTLIRKYVPPPRPTSKFWTIRVVRRILNTILVFISPGQPYVRSKYRKTLVPSLIIAATIG